MQGTGGGESGAAVTEKNAANNSRHATGLREGRATATPFVAALRSHFLVPENDINAACSLFHIASIITKSSGEAREKSHEHLCVFPQ
jgi:hypothetical protein